ncbi:MAG: lactoylglutathione lyase [Epulopiscium sp. Nele67-Bin004]|nr:MAG: lactoylglutathione lyase [Epulopiscium sp. Nele67-Bin004]
MKCKFEHACIRVFDLEKSIKFYEEALGFEVVRRKDVEQFKFSLVFMSDADRNFEIELTYNYDPEQAYELGNGFSHFAVIVEDINEAYAKHQEMGVTVSEIKTIADGFATFYFIADPDGYRTEVIARKQ